MKSKIFIVIGAIVLFGGAFAYVAMSNQDSEVSVPEKTLPKWANQSEVAVESVPISGHTYKISDKLDITSKARIRPEDLPAGWRLVEESGSGDESAFYRIEKADKSSLTASTVRQSPGALGTIYDSTATCTKQMTERYTAKTIMEQLSGAIRGSVKEGDYTTYVIRTDKGDGVEMGRRDVSYKDKDGNDRYRIYMLRCSDTNIVAVSLTGNDAQSVQEMAKTVLSKLIIKGVV